MGIRIVLVDDHDMIRHGLRTLLESQNDFQIVGEASNGTAGIRLIEELMPQVAVMDLAMPELNGIEATRIAMETRPDLKIVALSALSDERSVREMLHAGAAGYIIKEAAFDELAAAIRAVVSNRIYLSASLNGVILRDYMRGTFTAKDSAFTLLSARERQILQLIAEGQNTKEIAARLDLSAKTVETHRRNLMIKTGAQGVADLTRYAIREGITSPQGGTAHHGRE